ncbi:MAG: hypothetical protein WCH32_01390 [Pseudomonadota bacterium]
MTPGPTTPKGADEGGYAQACAAWQHALGDYLRLARAEASSAKLRVAAAAVHAASLRKGRLAAGPHDDER